MRVATSPPRFLIRAKNLGKNISEQKLVGLMCGLRGLYEAERLIVIIHIHLGLAHCDVHLNAYDPIGYLSLSLLGVTFICSH